MEDYPIFIIKNPSDRRFIALHLVGMN